MVFRGNYFGGEPIRKTKVEARVRRAAGKNEVKGKMIKGGGDGVVD